MGERRWQQWLRERNELGAAECTRVDAQLCEREARAGASADDKVAGCAARKEDILR